MAKKKIKKSKRYKKVPKVWVYDPKRVYPKLYVGLDKTLIKKEITEAYSIDLLLEAPSKVKNDEALVQALASPKTVKELETKLGDNPPISKIMWWLKYCGYEFAKTKKNGETYISISKHGVIPEKGKKGTTVVPTMTIKKVGDGTVGFDAAVKAAKNANIIHADNFPELGEVVPAKKSSMQSKLISALETKPYSLKELETLLGISNEELISAWHKLTKDIAEKIKLKYINGIPHFYIKGPSLTAAEFNDTDKKEHSHDINVPDEDKFSHVSKEKAKKWIDTINNQPNNDYSDVMAKKEVGLSDQEFDDMKDYLKSLGYTFKTKTYPDNPKIYYSIDKTGNYKNIVPKPQLKYDPKFKPTDSAINIFKSKAGISGYINKYNINSEMLKVAAYLNHHENWGIEQDDYGHLKASGPGFIAHKEQKELEQKQKEEEEEKQLMSMDPFKDLADIGNIPKEMLFTEKYLPKEAVKLNAKYISRMFADKTNKDSYLKQMRKKIIKQTISGWDNDGSNGKVVLTSEERNAVSSYTGSAYSGLNKTLYEGDAVVNEKGYINTMDERMSSSIKKVSPFDEDITVFSGIKIKDPRDVMDETGIFNVPAYMSTSLRFDIAQGFTGGTKANSVEDAYKTEHILKIKIPKGMKAMYVKEVSGHKSEEEVILHKNSKIKLKGPPICVHKLEGGYGNIARLVWEAELVHDGIL